MGEVSLARGIYSRKKHRISKDRPTVHALGHNSLVAIQKRVLPELQWYTLTPPDSFTVRVLYTRWFLIHNLTQS